MFIQIDKQIEIVKNQIAQGFVGHQTFDLKKIVILFLFFLLVEQIEATNRRNELENLRLKTNQLKFEQKQAERLFQREEHQNFLRECEQRRIEREEYRLTDRVEHLTQQWKEKTAEHQRQETQITTNQIHLEKLQRKLMMMNKQSAKLIEMNHQLERILQEHRFIRIDEDKRLRQLKQISVEKQKILFDYAKRFHRLSLRQRRLTQSIDRMKEQMKQSDQILDQSNRDEKVFETKKRIVRNSTRRFSFLFSFREKNKFFDKKKFN